MTVSEKTPGEVIGSCVVKDEEVIHQYAQEGGLAVLYGNLAPGGAIVKRCFSEITGYLCPEIDIFCVIKFANSSFKCYIIFAA